MAPKKKVMQAKTERSLSKAAIAEVLIGECKMQKAQVTAWLDSLAGLAAKELQSTGKFTIPGVCMIKTREKAATKAGKRLLFGKEVVVKAHPAKKVVKAFPVAALKHRLRGSGHF